MDTREIKEKVLFVIGTVLKQNFDLNSEIEAESLPEWNSLKHIEIMFAIEDELGIEFSSEELSQLNSVAKIVIAVNNRVE